MADLIWSDERDGSEKRKMLQGLQVAVELIEKLEVFSIDDTIVFLVWIMYLDT